VYFPFLRNSLKFLQYVALGLAVKGLNYATEVMNHKTPFGSEVWLAAGSNTSLIFSKPTSLARRRSGEGKV
jgi:hypothetical protein